MRSLTFIKSPNTGAGDLQYRTKLRIQIDGVLYLTCSTICSPYTKRVSKHHVRDEEYRDLIVNIPKTESGRQNTDPMELYASISSIDGRRLMLVGTVRASKYTADSLFNLTSDIQEALRRLRLLSSEICERAKRLICSPHFRKNPLLNNNAKRHLSKNISPILRSSVDVSPDMCLIRARRLRRCLRIPNISGFTGVELCGAPMRSTGG